jgi:hypothetical protein
LSGSRRIFLSLSTRQNNDIAFCGVVLFPPAIAVRLLRMSRWRLTMRELSAEARLHLYARALSRKTGTGFHAAALYGAFALIAGVVFGTLSIHPF